MGIRIISFLHPKDKNSTIEEQEKYETYNNKRIASIYAKINNNYIELIHDYSDTATIMSKFRLQFADKGWSARLTAYHNLHQINFVDYIDMPNYVSKL